CTDGSELSGEAEKHGIALAKSLGAEVVAVSVTPGIYYGMVGEGLAYAGELQRQAVDNAKIYLERVAVSGKDAGVAVEKVNAYDRPPYEGIVETADEKNCDLIVMASHGWRGFKQLLLGSEAKMVISHSKVPVLIYRRDRKESL
ncbi:MAG: universal stress protein, partial [Methyloligellaceae bacterium]